MAGALQELTLLLEDDVFPPVLLVMTMNEDYLHNLPFPAWLPSGDRSRINSQFGTYVTPFRLAT